MSKIVRRRTAAVIMVVSLGLLTASSAEARPSRAGRQEGSVAIHLQGIARIWLDGALEALTSAFGLDGGSTKEHKPGHKPPGQQNNGEARDGAGLDPHGGNPRGNDNNP